MFERVADPFCTGFSLANCLRTSTESFAEGYAGVLGERDSVGVLVRASKFVSPLTTGFVSRYGLPIIGCFCDGHTA